MATDHIARASIKIHALPEEVWDALINPEVIREYLFGTTVTTDWKEGSRIRWTGEWQGRSYEDRGKVLKFQPQRLLQYSHFSPLTGKDDKPENYHTVTITLHPREGAVELSLKQDNNTTAEERDHSERNWQLMLETLKKYLEEDRYRNASSPA